MQRLHFAGHGFLRRAFAGLLRGLGRFFHFAELSRERVQPVLQGGAVTRTLRPRIRQLLFQRTLLVLGGAGEFGIAPDLFGVGGIVATSCGSSSCIIHSTRRLLRGTGQGRGFFADKEEIHHAENGSKNGIEKNFSDWHHVLPIPQPYRKARC